MSKSTGNGGGGGQRSPRIDLRAAVAQRTRDLAGAARARAQAQPAFAGGGSAPRPAAGGPSPGSRAPGWMVLAAELLPGAVREILRDALRVEVPPPAPDPELDRQRERLREQREDLRHRESALDAARTDLDRAARLQDEARRELGAREREAERLLAEAQRALAEGTLIRRVPLSAVRWRESDSPRPLRDLARLAANLRRFGQLTPVVVRPEGESLRLVSGYRRMAALKQAGFTHVDVRVAGQLDDRQAAALYVAENCLPLGVTSKAIAQLAARLGDDASPEMARVLAEMQADDEAAVDELYLEDLAEEARNALAEGAAFVAALRPHWADLEPEDRTPLIELLRYFAQIAAKIGVAPAQKSR